MMRGTSSGLATLLAAQRALDARIVELGSDPWQVLAVGADLLEFAAHEEPMLFPLLPLLDPAVCSELSDEHQQLASDLELLQSLVDSGAETGDAVELAGALARRMRQHILRDGRLLTQAVRLAQR